MHYDSGVHSKIMKSTLGRAIQLKKIDSGIIAKWPPQNHNELNAFNSALVSEENRGAIKPKNQIMLSG